MPRLLELFCGTKSVGRAFEAAGWEVVSLDIVSKFEPTILCDIRSWDYTTFPGHFDMEFYHVFSSYRATCPSSPGELGQLRAAVLQALSVLRPDSRQAIPCALPRRKPELGQELGQGTWTNFITCFPLTEPLVQVRPGNLDKELGQLRAAVLQALSVLRPDSRQAPIPCASLFRGRFPNGFYST